MRWLKYILRHSFFVALCASGLTFYTYLLLQIPVNSAVCGLVFFLTLGAYNFYWTFSLLLNDRQRKTKSSFSDYAGHLILIILSAVAILDLIWFRPGLIKILMIPFFSTLAYCFLLLKNSYRIKPGFIVIKSVLLALTWTFTTALIPMQSLDNAFKLNALLILGTRFILLLMICIIFEIKDVYSVRSFSKLLWLLMLVLLILHAGLALMLDKMNFFIMCSTGAIAYLLYLLSVSKKRGYLFYYLIVDGLMLLMSIAGYLATI